MRAAKHKSAFVIKTLSICFVLIAAFGCNPGLGKITIHAELDFLDMGGLRPVAKNTIYLLSDSITSPEMEEAFRTFMASTTPPVNPGIPLTEKEARTRAGFMMSDGRKIWHRYIIESGETDYDGNATFKRLKAGDYWLYSITRRPAGEYLIWNEKVTVKFYDNTDVKLSRKNLLQ